MCIAVNYIDTLLVIGPILAKFKPGIVGYSSCLLRAIMHPQGAWGERLDFVFNFFVCVFWEFLKIVFGRIYAQPMFYFSANKI